MKAEVQERFAVLAANFEREPGVSQGEPGIRGAFGRSALKVDGKIFAMVSSSGRFVLKLPKGRVDTLVALGAGQNFEAGKGRPMKEWIAMDPGSESWTDLAREALRFVRGRP